MLPLIPPSQNTLVQKIISYPLKMIQYDDYIGHKELLKEELDVKKIKFSYRILPSEEEIVRDYNVDVLKYRSIKELSNVYSAGLGIYSKDGCFFPDTCRRQIERNGKQVFLPLSNPNDEIIHPYAGTNLFFLSRRERNCLIKSSSCDCSDEVFYLNCEFGHYGHFLYEIIPRLWGINHSSTKKIIINTQPKQWVIDLLKPFGISAANINFTQGKILSCKKMIIASQLTTTARFISTEVLDIYDIIKKYYLTSDASPSKIYLSRKKIKKRSLSNEVEVEKIFSSYGFTIVYPEEMSVSEQINCMCKAKYVAGPKGTALHNTFFRGNAKPLNLLMLDTKVPSSGNPDNYFLNFAALNVRTNIVYGTNSANDTWTVDLATLKKSIQIFLAQ